MARPAPTRRAQCALLIAASSLYATVGDSAPDAAPAVAAPAVLDAAARFGALERVLNPRLSPDGSRMVYVVPGPGRGSTLYMADFATSHSRGVATSDGNPMLLTACDWPGPERLVCQELGLTSVPSFRSKWAMFQRMISIDTDGTHLQTLGHHESNYQYFPRLDDGEVIDWLSGTGDSILMSRVYMPEKTTGRLYASKATGLGVDLVNTRTMASSQVEPPRDDAGRYYSDGQGAVRLMRLDRFLGDGRDTGERTYYYRRKGTHEWQELGKANIGKDSGILPLAVDSNADVVYVLAKLDGRRALYRTRMDGSMTSELVLSRPDVDVHGVVVAGRNGHVIGATWTTEYSQVEYFDPDYRKLAAALSKVIPELPQISFASASADEQVVLIRASSDRDPGRFYVFDRRSHQLDLVATARPQLEGIELAHQKPVEFPAADGTPIPGYLTLPPGVTDPKGLPALVMPHGGPASRDQWGFDWLAQFYANRGYVVLQPNFRGSSGYGDTWFVQNGFKNWKLAVGDVCDGGRWLVAQGFADPAHLGIVGWSYGGYAALQSSVLSPGLFKAVVAIAPVTDFGMVRDEARVYSDYDLAFDFIGSGPHIAEGSPLRHVEAFVSPVLMFHGDMDVNVSITESRAMDEALRKAGKPSQLVEYAKLDHHLADGATRADMLRRSDAFLRASMGLPPGP